jgi:hypothetical protein
MHQPKFYLAHLAHKSTTMPARSLNLLPDSDPQITGTCNIHLCILNSDHSAPLPIFFGQLFSSPSRTSGHEVFALMIDRKQVWPDFAVISKHSARTMGDKGRLDLQLSIHVPGTSLLLRLAYVFCRRMGTCRRVVPYVSGMHMVAALWFLYPSFQLYEFIGDERPAYTQTVIVAHSRCDHAHSSCES